MCASKATPKKIKTKDLKKRHQALATAQNDTGDKTKKWTNKNHREKIKHPQHNNNTGDKYKKALLQDRGGRRKKSGDCVEDLCSTVSVCASKATPKKIKTKDLKKRHQALATPKSFAKGSC